MSTYRWTDASEVTPREATPLANLAHAWFDGRTNFAEWYFPARLAGDLAACGGLAVGGCWMADRVWSAMSSWRGDGRTRACNRRGAAAPR